MNKKKIFLKLFLLIFIFLPGFVSAAEFSSGENYYLKKDLLVNDNLYVGASNIEVLGKVAGDVTMAGENIIISGPVEGGVLAAGGDVSVSGNISLSARIAGGNVSFSGATGQDLLIAGGQIEIKNGSSVGKDLVIFGDKIMINGKIDGNLKIYGEEIAIGPDAVISGNFDYSSQKEALIDENAKISGAINFKKEKTSDHQGMAAAFFGLISFMTVIKILSVLIMGFLVIHFFRQETEKIVKKSVDNFWKEVWRGFIILVLSPIFVIISFITMAGYLLGITTLLLYFFLLILASIFSVFLFSRFCLIYLFKKPEQILTWWIFAISAIALLFVSIIPIIGWVFGFLIFLASLGSIAMHISEKMKPEK